MRAGMQAPRVAGGLEKNGDSEIAISSGYLLFGGFGYSVVF